MSEQNNGFFGRLLKGLRVSPSLDRRAVLRLGVAAVVEGTLGTTADAQTQSQVLGANFSTLQRASGDPKIATVLEKGNRQDVLAAVRALPEQGNVLSASPDEQRRLLGNLVAPSTVNRDVSKWPAVGFAAETQKSSVARRGAGNPTEHRFMNGIPVTVEGKPALLTSANSFTGTIGDDFSSIDSFYSAGTDVAVKNRLTGPDGRATGIFQNAMVIKKNSFGSGTPDRAIFTVLGYTLTGERKWNAAAQAGTAWNLARFGALRSLIQEQLNADAKKVMSDDTLKRMINSVIPKYLSQCYAVKVSANGDLSPAGNAVGEVNSGGLAIAAGAKNGDSPVPFGIKSMSVSVGGIQFLLVHGPQALQKMAID